MRPRRPLLLRRNQPRKPRRRPLLLGGHPLPAKHRARLRQFQRLQNPLQPQARLSLALPQTLQPLQLRPRPLLLRQRTDRDRQQLAR